MGGIFYLINEAEWALLAPPGIGLTLEERNEPQMSDKSEESKKKSIK